MQNILQLQVELDTIAQLQDTTVAMFVGIKECLYNNITPFIITVDKQAEYKYAVGVCKQDCQPLLKLCTQLQEQFAERVKTIKS